MKLFPEFFSIKKQQISLFLMLFFAFIAYPVLAQESYISHNKTTGYFPLVSGNEVAEIFVDPQDHKGVLRVAEDFREDIERVTGKMPFLKTSATISANIPVVIGTVGKSTLIDDLVRNNKIDVSDIEGKWETFSIQVVNDPYPNVKQALVISGSDKRGTIFGMYDVSEEIGVSPWYWWADVPVKKLAELYVQPGNHSKGTPKVKYRGIFINDEEPGLGNWAREKFGGINSKMYDHVFELILR